MKIQVADVLGLVLQFLDRKSLLSASTVNKFWHTVVQQHPALGEVLFTTRATIQYKHCNRNNTTWWELRLRADINATLLMGTHFPPNTRGKISRIRVWRRMWVRGGKGNTVIKPGCGLISVGHRPFLNLYAEDLESAQPPKHGVEQPMAGEEVDWKSVVSALQPGWVWLWAIKKKTGDRFLASYSVTTPWGDVVQKLPWKPAAHAYNVKDQTWIDPAKTLKDNALTDSECSVYC
eukprot:TRINITY_DN52152_c0_g1_i1.p1 TRINITY_DN52152_c0_g1~~TRINITY_DN52152_c0_g1_i1.p1  ORF type:complete len:242 (+),score=7.22 TRINITY_DN52152_c0_g1_i1:26-727(+)